MRFYIFSCLSVSDVISVQVCVYLFFIDSLLFSFQSQITFWSHPIVCYYYGHRVRVCSRDGFCESHSTGNRDRPLKDDDDLGNFTLCGILCVTTHGNHFGQVSVSTGTEKALHTDIVYRDSHGTSVCSLWKGVGDIVRWLWWWSH